jgi:hypothetical protein
MEENQEITEKKFTNEKNFISIQLRLKINFKNTFIDIKVLQNNRIGIISNDSLIIYSLYTFKEILEYLQIILKKKAKIKLQMLTF